MKKNFESIANLVKYEWKGFKNPGIFSRKKKKKFRNSYHYFEKLGHNTREHERSYRQHCEEVVYPKGPQFRKGKGKFGLSVGQFHRAVNNDISEGMVGYRNFGSPLDSGNDRTRR